MLKRRNLWMLPAAIGAFLMFGTVFALATPGSGVVGTIVARGTLGTPPVTIAVPKVVTVKVKKKVRGKLRTITVKKTISQAISTCASSTPCDTAVHLVTIAPGGTTGWHSHAGSTFLAIASGEGVEYHAEGTSCMSERHPAGSGFFQGKYVHVLHNEGTVPLVVYAFYILPSGTENAAIRIDQPAPAACPGIN